MVSYPQVSTGVELINRIHFATTCAQVSQMLLHDTNGNDVLLILQTFRLAQYAFVDYASIVLFDIYTNTASDLIGGLFNLAAVCYYIFQVWKVSLSHYSTYEKFTKRSYRGIKFGSLRFWLPSTSGR
jgi:hypothetical protein